MYIAINRTFAGVLVEKLMDALDAFPSRAEVSTKTGVQYLIVISYNSF